MQKHFRQALVAAAVVGAVASGISGTASAYVYGLSTLDVSGFVFAGSTNVTVNNYVFTLQNSATKTGDPSVLTNAACSGTPTTTTCGTPPGSGLGNVLDATVAAIPAGARGSENNFSFVGTGTTYASSDSVIYTAQLVDGVPSSEQQIAEANLLVNGQATGQAELQSTTNLTYNITVSGTGSFTLNFNADADMRAAILEALGGVYNSQSNINTSFTLTQTATGNTISWKPNGVLEPGTGCVSTIVGAVCVETADGGGFAQTSLNQNLSTGANPSDALFSYDAAIILHPYGISVTGLAPGTYSLGLNAVTSVNILRQAVVPEPVTLALVGVGLLGMGLSLRRRSNKA